MKLVRCKRCGVEHECAGRMSNVERARKAAASRRWKNPDGTLNVGELGVGPPPVKERQEKGR